MARESECFVSMSYSFLSFKTLKLLQVIRFMFWINSQQSKFNFSVFKVSFFYLFLSSSNTLNQNPPRSYWEYVLREVLCTHHGFCQYFSADTSIVLVFFIRFEPEDIPADKCDIIVFSSAAAKPGSGKLEALYTDDEGKNGM